ncbi:hypothetical protein [Thalassotalea sp. PLHSN55]|uniref:hypothetical protein n=1 Tax=Thalassotalea sp. PLHSN55 TaxID=3435888 RepID=UPI003F868689
MKISQTASALQAVEHAKKQAHALKKPAEVALEQEKQQGDKQQSRFDVNEQSLLLVQQNQQQQSSQSQSFKHTDYDQPSMQNQTAVSVYQSVSNLSQRENIQQIFGVDLLA